VVLHRTDARYEDVGHAHRVIVSGRVGRLRARIRHDDRKALCVWISAQARYARREADMLISSPGQPVRTLDRIRRTAWLAPLLMPIYCLFYKRLLLDGRIGLFYTVQRTYAELLLALELRARALLTPVDETRPE
jgi:hypothetical protein